MTKENPYKSFIPDDSKPGKSWSKFIATPSLFLAMLALAFVAGTTMLRNGTWIALLFICPAVAIIIAASQFGVVSITTSLKSIATFIGVCLAGCIAFAVTCTGVNITSIENAHSIDDGQLGLVTTITTLLGCFCSFVLSKWLLRGKE